MRDDTNRMPVTCPNCGREIDGREQFCPECGAFLWEEQGAPAETQVTRQDMQQQPEGQQPEEHAAVQLRLKSDLINVAPGSAGSTAFSVKNLGTQVEEFQLLITGPSWVSIEPTLMSVYPGQEGTGTIQAAPPRLPSTIAGAAPFQLTVTSAVHAQVSGSASGRVDVAPFYELAAELTPSSTTGRGTTRCQLRLDNRGNAPVTIPLRIADVADGLRLGVPAYGNTGPGQVTEVPVQVSAVRLWFGRPAYKTFAIIADAPEPLAAARLSGTRVVVPQFAGWVPKAAVAVAAVAVAAVAVVAVKHTSSTTPTGAVGSSAGPGSYDLLAQATSASWLSVVSGSSSGTPSIPTPVAAAHACQPEPGLVTTTKGYAERLDGATMTNGQTVNGAVETDAPASANAEIVGVYTLTSATSKPETFSAQIGFCQGGDSSNTEVQYQVIAGPAAVAPSMLPSGTPPVTSGTLSPASAALVPVTGQIPIGTQTVELVVTNTSSSPLSSSSVPTPSTFPASVVWLDPNIHP